MADTHTGNRGKEEHRPMSSEEAKGGAVEKAKEMTATATEKARGAAAVAGQRADDAASAVGSGMRTLAGTLRERAPREGAIGSASSRVADTLESGAHYLEEHGMTGMLDDLTGLIRRNPIPAMLVGIGIGFLIARTTSRATSRS
jgi:hypothetical protein